MEVLIDNGANVDDKDKESSDSLLFYQWVCLLQVWSPLMRACYYGNSNIVKVFGADVNEEDKVSSDTCYLIDEII